jgi:predicted RecA/RadA family phage recombinase
MSGGRPAEAPGRHWDALVVHPDDDVAVALRDVQAGETVHVRRAGTVVRAQVTQAIPLGHKFALHALAKGAPVRKYGESIGVATADIAPGSHVHVHNMESRRARKAM